MTKHSKARELGQGSHAMLTNNILPVHISLSDMTASKHSPASQLFASFSLFTLLLFLLCTLVPTLPLAQDGSNISPDTSARSTNSSLRCKNAHCNTSCWTKHRQVETSAQTDISARGNNSALHQQQQAILRLFKTANWQKENVQRTTLTPQSKAKHQDLLLAERLDPVATFILSLCSPNSYFFQPLMIPNCENLLNYFAYLI